MTILNVWIEPRRALVGVDTAMVLPSAGNAIYQVSKLLPLAHANLVMGVRGCYGFFSCAFARYQASPCGFDDLVEATPEILRDTFAVFLENALKIGFPDVKSQALDQVEFFLVGYSPKARQIVGMLFKQEDRSIGFVGGEIRTKGCYSAPGMDPLPCQPNNEANMIQLARAQKRLLNETHPDAAVGGKLILATIERDHMSFATVCDLDQDPQKPTGRAWATPCTFGRGGA